MTADYTVVGARRAAEGIATKLGGLEPAVAIVLGSGLGGLARKIQNPVRIPFAQIAGFPETTVVGHEGAVIGGILGGQKVIALSGRFHLYEGHPASLAAFPIRLFRALGAKELVVSNAAGGISPKLGVGDLMAITDHLNLTGTNPLTGALQDGDMRFPDMTDAYDPRLRRQLRTAAERLDIPLKEGVYAGLPGPSYETPSEVKMLRVLGADAVGMSTVPEVIVARALGMRVAGVSCITNAGSGLSGSPLSHAEVLDTTAKVSDKFEALIIEFLASSSRPDATTR